jgi:hypothetical protein
VHALYVIMAGAERLQLSTNVHQPFGWVEACTPICTRTLFFASTLRLRLTRIWRVQTVLVLLAFYLEVLGNPHASFEVAHKAFSLRHHSTFRAKWSPSDCLAAFPGTRVRCLSQRPRLGITIRISVPPFFTRRQCAVSEESAGLAAQ